MKNLPLPAGSIWIIQNALRAHYLIVRINNSVMDFEILAALLAAVKLSRISAEYPFNTTPAGTEILVGMIFPLP